MTRTEARIEIFKSVYAQLVSGRSDTFDHLVESLPADPELGYIVSTYQGIQAKREFLASVVARYAIGFAFDRIFKVDLAVLYVATYEVLFGDVPQKAAVSSAVDIAKAFSTVKSVGFTNGVLASVIRDRDVLLEEHESATD